MKITIQDKVIEIPDELIEVQDKPKMNAHTSYLERFCYNIKHNKRYYTNFRLKMQCLANIKKAVGDLESYFDIMAGLGFSARIFEADAMVLNDLCPKCSSVLDLNFIDKVTSEDLFTMDWVDSYDMIFADFNNFTMKSYEQQYSPIMESVFNSAERYVLLNDCSVFYLNYGPKSYKTYSKFFKKPINDRHQYYAAAKEFFHEEFQDWWLTRIESFKEASFMLFEREDKPLYHMFNYRDNLTIPVTIG